MTNKSNKNIRIFRKVEINNPNFKNFTLNIGEFLGEEFEVISDNRGEYQENIYGDIYDENESKVQIDGRIYKLWRSTDSDDCYVNIQNI
jgi:hypothetical protein